MLDDCENYNFVNTFMRCHFNIILIMKNCVNWLIWMLMDSNLKIV